MQMRRKARRARFTREIAPGRVGAGGSIDESAQRFSPAGLAGLPRVVKAGIPRNAWQKVKRFDRETSAHPARPYLAWWARRWPCFEFRARVSPERRKDLVRTALRRRDIPRVEQ